MSLSTTNNGEQQHQLITLQGINISHLGKRNIIFKMPFLGDMLVPWRVSIKLHQHQPKYDIPRPPDVPKSRSRTKWHDAKVESLGVCLGRKKAPNTEWKKICGIIHGGYHQKKNCDKHVPSQCPYVLPKLKTKSVHFLPLLATNVWGLSHTHHPWRSVSYHHPCWLKRYCSVASAPHNEGWMTPKVSTA